MHFDVPRILQDIEQGRVKASRSAFPCFDVICAGLLRFLLGLLARQTRSLVGVHLSVQGVNNVLTRVQQRIEEELSSIRVLGLTELAEEEGALRDLSLCFLEHDLSPRRYEGTPEVMRSNNRSLATSHGTDEQPVALIEDAHGADVEEDVPRRPRLAQAACESRRRPVLIGRTGATAGRHSTA